MTSATMALVACNAGLLMVDHVHFQYNGVLLGVLIASLAALQSGCTLIGGILFAVLLNMKHLFLVLAPVYFVYILRGWVWGRGWLPRLGAMAAAVLTVCAASMGPIIATGHGLDLLQRCASDAPGRLDLLLASPAISGHRACAGACSSVVARV